MKERLNFKIDFIGIGLERAGTTWIFECLKEHPQICCSKYKEVKFFSQKTQFGDNDEKYQRGLRYYQSYFSHCQPRQIKGEFSPHYFFELESARRIKKHFPDVKLILCLRNPIDRAYSFYWYEKTRGKIPADYTFEDAINREFVYFVKEGFYCQPLQYYLSLFPKEHILILIYEDIDKNPTKFIQQIYSFLGVDDRFIPQNAYRLINTPYNKNKFQLFLAASILKTKKLLTKNSLGRKTVNWLEKSFFASWLTALLEKKSGSISQKPTRPPIEPKTKNFLLKLYQDDITQLEEILQRKLSAWR